MAGRKVRSVPLALQFPPEHPVDLRINLGERGTHALVGEAKPRCYYPVLRGRFVHDALLSPTVLW
jgi:hypothetical protein